MPGPHVQPWVCHHGRAPIINRACAAAAGLGGGAGREPASARGAPSAAPIVSNGTNKSAAGQRIVSNGTNKSRVGLRPTAAQRRKLDAETAAMTGESLKSAPSGHLYIISCVSNQHDRASQANTVSVLF